MSWHTFPLGESVGKIIDKLNELEEERSRDE